MKTWIIVAVLIGILAVAGIIVSITGSVVADESDGNGAVTCSTCGNSCTGERNCGLASCGAVQGKSCGCKG